MQFTDQFRSAVAESTFVKNLAEGFVEMDNSEFTQWDGCFVQGLYAGALKRQPTGSRAPLAFGDIIHTGLEAYFRGEDWRTGVRERLAKNNLESLGDPRRSVAKAFDLLESFFLEYERKASMRFDIITLGDKPAVELPFAVPLGEFLHKGRRIRIIWTGKIDLLTEYSSMIAPIDHKTTTVMGEKFVDDKVRSSQMLGYTYASRFLLRELMPDKKVFGVRINALALRSQGFEFRQFDIPYAEWKIAEWQRETILKIKLLAERVELFLETSIGLPTREHCVTKYGRCPFFDVCDALPVMRDRMFFDETFYFKSEWSPLKRD